AGAGGTAGTAGTAGASGGGAGGVAGCGATGGSAGTGGSGGAPAANSFAAVRAVFDSRCAGCHNGVGAAATRVKLDDIGSCTTLSNADLYATLTTGLPDGTQTCGGKTLVVPSDLVNSFIVTKLTVDNPVCGTAFNRMPLGCTTTPAKCLTSDELTTIENWITGGALH
ncbi:MAG TPA: hypothetical protein VIK01_05310, partial [Polyangiaceae bacterium]